MHGLASVLKQPIRSIYPEVGEQNRPFYHKVIQPREACQLDPLIIMWTRALPIPLNKRWQPNLFTPCLINSTSAPSVETAKDNAVPVVSHIAGNAIQPSISTHGVKHAHSHSEGSKKSIATTRGLKTLQSHSMFKSLTS